MIRHDKHGFGFPPLYKYTDTNPTSMDPKYQYHGVLSILSLLQAWLSQSAHSESPIYQQDAQWRLPKTSAMDLLNKSNNHSISKNCIKDLGTLRQWQKELLNHTQKRLHYLQVKQQLFIYGSTQNVLENTVMQHNDNSKDNKDNFTTEN